MSGSGVWMRASTSSESTWSDGSPRRDFAGEPVDTDDVAEMHVDLARALDRAEELDPPAAVDEIEEDELAHVAARHHAAREPAFRLRGCAVLVLFGLGANAAISSRSGKRFARGHDPRV